MEEIQERSKPKVPTFLAVLIVLSSINISFGLISQLVSIGDAPPDDLEITIEEAIYSSNVDIDDLPDWFLPDLMDLVSNITENYGLINAVDLAYYLVLMPTMFLMFRLRVMGYYIYVVTQIIGVAYIPLLYGSNVLSWVMVGVFAFTAMLFILLYTLNRKHMS